ncbi:hypothetical protein M2324_003959 [Rhodovulum sulfidophilum]|uniref:hypothetical protein n=1 Tax=Rhodovulum sulfidophilum TaxID=35806 RepID=UPI0005AA1541|nr:hypothetical protein [Rhodovulum sulfidophilum]ANB35197.1 hypothetical protein A6W98_14620 [Rhodovulum sulfidophilum DSM 1374]ANB39019.1 hypothetical protein A6024_14485 [Rhodovulum sulfidophilum]MCW2305533.1 hypothetical protein [Rhodovulum sulfidophilum]
MTWIIDQLIAFLAELRGLSLLSQVLTLAGIPSVIAFLFGIPAWLMTRRVRDAVANFDAVEAQLKTARREAARLKAEVNALEAQTPEAFLADHRRDIENRDDEGAMARAEKFVNRQREALLLAFRTRMDEAIGQSVEDGAPAFATARLWAQAARALAPGDRMLGMLIDELAEAEAVAASGAGVRLKGDADRQDRATRMDRLPSDLEALRAAFWRARARGHYAVMLVLAEHGLTLTRRRPFGDGSQEHLGFRFCRAAAWLLGGARARRRCRARGVAAA